MAHQPPESSSPQRPPRGAIISPTVDFLCCGGLSIVAVAGLFAYSLISPGSPLFARGPDLRTILLLEVVINSPHFLASYHLLYRRRERIVQHRWASIYVPLLLLALIVYALLTPHQGTDAAEFANGTVVELFGVAAVMLLAWHYTGQAWGMTASFAYIDGIRMDRDERQLIRGGYHALLVWHVLWAMLATLKNPDIAIGRPFYAQIPYVELAYNVWAVVVFFTIPLGLYGFLQVRRRTGKTPPARSYGPWIAIYFWYTLIWVHPGLFVLLQIFHALQYLIFPIRVEVNQYSAGGQRSERRRLFHGAAYYAALVIAGLIVFNLPLLANFWGDRGFALDALAVGFVNIHHYVIDGVIWKIRNPQVRRDLFAHLAPQ